MSDNNLKTKLGKLVNENFEKVIGLPLTKAYEREPHFLHHREDYLVRKDLRGAVLYEFSAGSELKDWLWFSVFGKYSVSRHPDVDLMIAKRVANAFVKLTDISSKLKEFEPYLRYAQRVEERGSSLSNWSGRTPALPGESKVDENSDSKPYGNAVVLQLMKVPQTEEAVTKILTALYPIFEPVRENAKLEDEVLGEKLVN